MTKRLLGVNVIPIGRDYENPRLNTRVYEVEYLDGNKESLYENNIAENIFSQVNKEGNRFVLFDDILYHCVGST